MNELILPMVKQVFGIWARSKDFALNLEARECGENEVGCFDQSVIGVTGVSSGVLIYVKMIV